MTGYESKRAAAQAKTIDEVNWADHEPNGLAQPEQEPVGKFAKFTDGVWREVTNGSAGIPLYATPQQRPWVGLTDEDIAEGLEQSWVTAQAFQSAVWWAEAKLKDKNT
jgi:hypothetical protein